MHQPKYRAGAVISGWTLSQLLGIGGNAEVWEAARPGLDSVALKILRNRHPDSEPYQRFRAEVDLLRRLDVHSGILPLLDSSLPDYPTNEAPAWLAMPIAKPISAALDDGPDLEIVVKAMATIAQTLADLSRQSIHHRDIKPSNLYLFDSNWVLGDFGLAKYPEKAELTGAEQKLGPLHYLAPEMLVDAARAAGEPADVYSLAKTLWVLCSGQRFPVPGEQRVEVTQLTLSAHVAHPRSQILDLLIERCTRHQPETRPSMAGVAAELDAWLIAPKAPPSLEALPALATRIAAVREPELRRRDFTLRVKQQTIQARDLMKSLLQPVSESLAQAGLSRNTSWLSSRAPDVFKICSIIGRSDGFVWQDNLTSGVAGARGQGFTSWVGLAGYPDEELWLAAAHVIKNSSTLEILWQEQRTVLLGSSQQEVILRELRDDLMQALSPAIECFTSRLEEKNNPSSQSK